ncbi:MAG: phage virion morphogenesis protein [Bacteroidales bacterium]|nr:phage virion morphogenesis protein [Bacteroidales bacterium]
MNPDQFKKLLIANQKQIKRFVSNIAPDLMGDAAVNHFKENFDKEGFVDETLKPWKEVKRRQEESSWYEFDANKPPKYRSTKRGKDKILKDTNQLQDSIEYEAKQHKVIIHSDIPYAAVHNYGQKAKIFGKKSFKMPKRQFIGHSKQLDKKIIKMLTYEIGKILK